MLVTDLKSVSWEKIHKKLTLQAQDRKKKSRATVNLARRQPNQCYYKDSPTPLMPFLICLDKIKIVI